MAVTQSIKHFARKVARRLSVCYYVFGDSHTEVFQYLDRHTVFKRFDVLLVGGATAQGMRNPNSQTNALQLFREKAERLPRNSRLVFQLGEVDTGFVIWYRALKHNENLDQQLRFSVETYFDFIDELIGKGFKRITVVSAPLPTIRDGQDWGDVANARKEIKATQLERTALTLAYNRLLQENCRRRKLRYIDCDADLLDQTTGLIHVKFRNRDKLNHHLDLHEYSEIIKKHL